MKTPKTITIYLADGEPTGIKIAELSQWIGKALVIPRSKLKNAKLRPEVNQPSVYFLFGEESEESDLPRVYIGEAEIAWDRLTRHDKEKDFWNTAVIFTSDKNDLDKADIKYLESRCIEIANRSNKCVLENGVSMSKNNLPEHKKSSIEEYLHNLKILLPSLGFTILQEPKEKDSSNSSETYPKVNIVNGDIKAYGRLTDEGFVVFKESTANAKPNRSALDKTSYLRNLEILNKLNLLEKVSEDIYKFKDDYVFKSPSASASFILGQSRNGWITWKDDSSKTLKEIEDEQLK